MKMLIMPLVLLFLCPSNSRAEAPIELITNYHTDVPSCKTVGNYFVRIQGKVQIHEVDFHQNKNQDVSEKSCRESKYGEPLFKHSSAGALYFDPSNNLLFIDWSWKTTSMHLSIYDIQKNKRVFYKEIYKYEFNTDTTLVLWIPDNKNVCTLEENKKAMLFKTAHISLRKHILDLKTMTLKSTEILKCEHAMEILS